MAQDPIISTPPGLLDKWRGLSRGLRTAGPSRGSNGGQLQPEQRRMSGVMCRVKCIVTGGSNGSGAFRASWVYTVRSLLGEELLTNATPEKLPLVGVTYAPPPPAGVMGDAYINANGVWVLARVDLEELTEACPGVA
jgi:hypothetical protein